MTDILVILMARTSLLFPAHSEAAGELNSKCIDVKGVFSLILYLNHFTMCASLFHFVTVSRAMEYRESGHYWTTCKARTQPQDLEQLSHNSYTQNRCTLAHISATNMEQRRARQSFKGCCLTFVCLF